MSTFKFYAVKKGVIPGIYYSWDEAKAQVDGFPGAIYKSFTSINDAKVYLGMAVETPKEPIVPNTEVKVVESNVVAFADAVAYTDGSYNKELALAGYGVVLLDKSTMEVAVRSRGCCTSESWQIEGELIAVVNAISLALGYGCESIEIRYDYEGVKKWATGQWSANKKCSVNYVKTIKKLRKLIDIKFAKVDAHTGDKYNEEADGLAKLGCGAV